MHDTDEQFITKNDPGHRDYFAANMWTLADGNGMADALVR